MMFVDDKQLGEILPTVGGRVPVVAVLDSGLDPFAPLPEGTLVSASRSFVGEDPSADVLGWGTGWAQLCAEKLVGRWGPEGPSELVLVIAQVVDRNGRGRPDALARALAWVSSMGVDAVFVPWLSSQEEFAHPRPGLTVIAGGRAA